MSTTKYFILVVIGFILVLIFVIGFNPFSFGDAYFRPRSSPPSAASDSEYLIIPENAQPTEVEIDR